MSEFCSLFTIGILVNARQVDLQLLGLLKRRENQSSQDHKDAIIES